MRETLARLAAHPLASEDLNQTLHSLAEQVHVANPHSVQSR